MTKLSRLSIGIGLSVVALLAAGTLGFFALASSYQSEYQGKIYPGLSIGTIDVGALSPEDAKTRVQQHLDALLTTGLMFRLDGKQTNLTSSQDPFIQYEVEQSVQRAFAWGRDGSFLQNSLKRFNLRWSSVSLPVAFTVQQEAIKTALFKELRPSLKLTEDAKLVAQFDEASKQVTTSITPEKVGTTIDLDSVWPTLSQQAGRFAFEPIDLPTTHLEPTLTQGDIQPLLPRVSEVLKAGPLHLTAEKQDWYIKPSVFAKWMTAEKTDSGIRLAADRELLAKDVQPLVNGFLVPVTNGKLVLEPNGDGYKMKDFVAPVEGVAFDDASTTQAVNNYFATAPTSTAVEITLAKVTPVIEGDDAARLGIKEALGTGRSNFARSPANRRHNIALGEQRVNGTLIAPGQEFSMLKTLGAVTGENGWLPELVIKGNKTTPEYGGGLCQIGTTAFRTAMESGLEITERQNHSYRVSYYEPAGTDATIYEPAPDFKFRNNTDHWILITGNIKGDNVSFTIWGTSDGRKGMYTYPKIWNIVQPPPTKLIETLDLKPGQKKCTESAHAGAEASIDYIVTSATGEKKVVTFHSKYRPWQAVCLVGVEKLTETNTGVDQTGGNNLN